MLPDCEPEDENTPPRLPLVGMSAGSDEQGRGRGDGHEAVYQGFRGPNGRQRIAGKSTTSRIVS
jgi:hypothetical protein